MVENQLWTSVLGDGGLQLILLDASLSMSWMIECNMDERCWVSALSIFFLKSIILSINTTSGGMSVAGVWLFVCMIMMTLLWFYDMSVRYSFQDKSDDLSRSASYSRTRLIPTKPSNNNWWWDEAACRDWTRKEEVRQLAFSDTSWHISWWLVSQIVICTGTIDMNSHRAVPHPHKLGRRFNESFGQ